MAYLLPSNTLSKGKAKNPVPGQSFPVPGALSVSPVGERHGVPRSRKKRVKPWRDRSCAGNFRRRGNGRHGDFRVLWAGRPDNAKYRRIVLAHSANNAHSEGRTLPPGRIVEISAPMAFARDRKPTSNFPLYPISLFLSSILPLLSPRSFSRFSVGYCRVGRCLGLGYGVEMGKWICSDISMGLSTGRSSAGGVIR